MVLVRTPAIRPRPTPWNANSLLRDVEQLLREAAEPRSRGQRAFPAINITADSDAFRLRAELPGVVPDDLDITVDQNTISIKGSRSTAIDEADASFHRRERAGGSFARSVTLPADIDADGVDADYRNGILTITVPKAPESKPRQVAVHAG